MTTLETPDMQPKRARFPPWATPLILAVAFLLVHVAVPWRLSLLSSRYGWRERRPGFWNQLGLVLVVSGIAATLRLIKMHYRASPDTFMAFQQSRKLMTPGPYAISRNPMYLSELTFWLGWALFYGSPSVLAGWLVLLAIFNFVAVPYEERDLERRFGEAYRQYRQRVPRWFGRTRS